MSLTATAIRIVDVRPYLIPVQTRVPLKFGVETLTEVTCLRVCLTVEDRRGQRAEGWGETPLSIQWVWPSELPYRERSTTVQGFAGEVARQLRQWKQQGHAFELGVQLLEHDLPNWRQQFNRKQTHPLPYLASLLVASAYDLALHDAQGLLLGADTYATYHSELLRRPLADFITPDPDCEMDFGKLHVDDFLVANPPTSIPVWHLVGALDPLTETEKSTAHPNDGYPVVLADWIRRDGLKCLKVKLRGTDWEWDYDRLVQVARVGLPLGVSMLSADFNCTVQQTEYVCEILDRLMVEHPHVWDVLAYIEQPFPYNLSELNLDVRSIAARKPIYLDESAHDWQHVRLGRALGWNGVALKTCKTQTGALLSLCWARAHGLGIMVQDLTNPMLAQIPHVRLAAHAGTAWGVESNAMQYYPDASLPEAEVHPGLFQRRNGRLDLASLPNADGKILGFGYRQTEIQRDISQWELRT